MMFNLHKKQLLHTDLTDLMYWWEKREYSRKSRIGVYKNLIIICNQTIIIRIRTR